MPMHDWKKVDANIFHAFHHIWITAVGQILNAGHLPPEYYALPEQVAGESNLRKKSSIVVRHVSGDRMVAVLEIVSPGNKSSRYGFRAFVSKACELLENRIHLLLVDPFPPTPRDPEGIHSAIWQEVTDELFQPPTDKPLTLAAYETGQITRAFIEPFAVGDRLVAMPLFLEQDVYVAVPLEATYQTAFTTMPLRWRRVLETDA
jgi:hypothetical protein